jgi:hypothetical protein
VPDDQSMNVAADEASEELARHFPQLFLDELAELAMSLGVDTADSFMLGRAVGGSGGLES